MRRKWKVGDTLKFIQEVGDCDESVFTIDNYYKIIYAEVTPIESFKVENDNGELWYIELDAFEFVKSKKKITEVDFLDAFQENFKDGV